MNAPETLSKLFQEGIPGLTKAVEAIPEDKLDWKPAEGSRTIRQLVSEIVMMPDYIAQALEQRAVPPYEEISNQYSAMSISELLAKLPENAKTLEKAMKNFPESDYEETLEAPWGTWTYFQTLSYPYWNMMWHTGQINYIQTMYGDQSFY